MRKDEFPIVDKAIEKAINEVLEEVKAEIDKQYKWLMCTNHTLADIDIAFDAVKYSIDEHISGKEKNEMQK